MDIEDCIDTLNVGPPPEDNVCIVKTRVKHAKAKDDCGQNDSVMPWTKAVYVKSWGCSHNSSDSEYMCGLLAQAGYPLVKDKEIADVWILNSCTVKTPSETTFKNDIEQGKKKGKFVVVAGCVSQAAPNEPYLKGISIIGVKQITEVVKVVEETIKGNCVRVLSHKRSENGLSAPKVRKNELIEILAINSGCLNSCTYCKTVQARGKLSSFKIEDLVKTAKNAFEVDGCKELWLTSEDLGAYGRDIGTCLPELLNEIVKIIPEDCMMRLGMTNPPYLLDHIEEIAQILNHPRVYTFIHLPVQAASDAVLADMKREYTISQFMELVDYLIENVPGIYLATDFICAFPTETNEDFLESMDLVAKYKFPSLFINQFYPRPNTPAAKLKKIDTKEARRRTSAMTDLFHSYSRYNEARIGETHRILVCEQAADGINLVGHNKNYEHILVANEDNIAGKWVDVKITEVSKFGMKSVRINKPKVSENIVVGEKGDKNLNLMFMIVAALAIFIYRFYYASLNM
uniref:tRNA-t(6)A37 methylthiotransferase n=1 Tax=Rhabditophanes sp. KR3021 TaxID=114890 RepID=A0AC35UAF2_9BILA